MDGLDELADMREAFHVAQLELELRVEGFLDAVLPWARLPALRGFCPVRLEERLICPCDVLASLIGVKPCRRGREPPGRVFEGLDDQCRRMVVRDVPTNDLSRKDVDHGSEMPEPVLKPEIGEVSRPDDVRPDRTEDFQDVRNACFRPSEIIRLHKPVSAPDARDDPKTLHEALGLGAADPKRERDPSRTVCRMFGHNGEDFCLVLCICRRFFRFVIERRSGATKFTGEGGGRQPFSSEAFTGRADFFPPASL